MAAIDVDVVRSLSAAPEVRAAKEGSDSLGVMTGHFSVQNNWYRVSSMWEGEFVERMAPGCFDQTIKEDRDSMRVLFDHGFDSIGNKVLGMISDVRGDGYYEVDLFDTSYNRDLYPGLKAGAYGASFRMKVEEDTWEDEPDASEFNPRGAPQRTITRAKVMEFGPVTFPANPKASASVRSETDQFYSRLRQRDEAAVAAACRAAGIKYPSVEDIQDFAAANPGNGKPGAVNTDSGPGSGARSAPSHPSEEAQARHRYLFLKGIVKK